MTDDPSADGSLGEIADAFLERCRRGESPSVEEYAGQFPALADEIREVFPTLFLIEAHKSCGTDAARGQDRAETDVYPEPPERLGDYRILRELGRGGMGIVYEAEQESLGRHVALKVLPGQALLDTKYLRRFRREARAAARLHHTNIVPVYGVGGERGMHYFVMQYIPGRGLDRVIGQLGRLQSGHAPAAEPAGQGSSVAGQLSALDAARSLLNDRFSDVPAAGTSDSVAVSAIDEADDANGAHEPSRQPLEPADVRPQPAASDSGLGPAPGSLATSGPSGLPAPGKRYWRSVARIGVQVADALQYAHAHDTIHRDIKPSNLLLDTQGVVWVTDFGLAKSVEQENLTQTGDVVGTLRYLAPESFKGHADARSDIYALGLTLYELVAFRPARDANDRINLLRQLTRGEIPHLEKLNPRVPRDLATVIQKAIETDPKRRYQTAAELGADLQRYLADQPIKARRVSSLERLWRWSKHHPAVAGLTAIVAVLLAVLVVGSLAAAISFERMAQNERRSSEQAKEAGRRADEAYRDSEAIARFLLDEVLAEGQRAQAPGRDINVEGFLDRASKRADDALANHPRRKARVHDAIAEGYQSLGLYQKAEREWSETLRLERSMNPPDRKNVAEAINDVARMLSYQGKHEEAVSLLQKLLPEQRELFGESHEKVADVMVRLGWSLREIGRAEDAEALIGQGLAMCRVTLPDGHWLTAEAEGVLGATLTAQRRYRDAESLLLRSYKALASAPGESDDAKGTMPRRIPQILIWIVELYQSWGKPEKANDYRRRLEALSNDDTKPPAR